VEQSYRFSRLPWSILASAVTLVTLSYLAIARAEFLAGSELRFAERQTIWAALAAAAMVAATALPYRNLARWSYLILLGALVCLAIVYLFPPVNGARRWIRAGVVGFQPSEFAKLAFVLALARHLMYRDSYRRLSGLLVPVALAFVPMLLIVREPDLGTALIFLPVLFLMLFAAGARRSHLVLAAFTACALLPALWSQMSAEQRSRITSLPEQPPPGKKVSDDGYHLQRAKQVLALGGAWGSLISGDAADERSAYYLPEAHTDSIFSVVAERFGLAGLALTMTLYLVILGRAIVIAQNTHEPFGRLIVVGMTSLLGVQVMINAGMMVGLIPITGLALPLVSYGGSSLLSSGLALGLIVNVAIHPGYEVAGEPFRFGD